MNNCINEIIFLPSLRCNLNCMHCGENQDVKREEEINCLDVLEQIRSSYLFNGNSIIITGGEPFLNDSLSYFLVKGIEETEYTFHVTSNGFYTEKISQVIEQISAQKRNRLLFSISIDGMEHTHNNIRRNHQSFNNAIRTVEYLVRQGITTGINTVVQKQNLTEIEELKKYMHSLSHSVLHSIIPLSIDISETEENIYTEEYKKICWENITTHIDKKKILSNGKYGVKSCHAGIQNIVIAADGKVYPCLTGGFYRGKEKRLAFCIGDLKKRTLDEILLSEARENVFENEVKRCQGCTNPCEVNREVGLFGQKVSLLDNEVGEAMEFDKNNRFGDALLDYTGWHTIETDGQNGHLCWSSENIAKLFVQGDKLTIKYRKLIHEQKLKILIDEKEILIRDDSVCGSLEIQLPDKGKDYSMVVFLVDKVLVPAELHMNADVRPLGIALEDVSLLRRA